MDENKLVELINRSEITSVVNAYFRALDDKHFDPHYFATIYAAEAKVTRPNGSSLIGPEEVSASHQQSFTRFEGSQHFLAGHEISIRWQYRDRHAYVARQQHRKADNFFVCCSLLTGSAYCVY